MLSNKYLYPSFLRTIPSDKNQVEAMIQLLVRFNWTWIVLLGSDDAYGLKGMQSLYQQAPDHGICIAYKEVIPSYRDDTIPILRNIVESIKKAKANTIVAFSSKYKLVNLFPLAIEQKVTEKVWIGTEDWSTSSLILEIPGIHTIGTVIGVSVKYVAISGFEEFEQREFKSSMTHSSSKNVSDVTMSSSIACIYSSDFYSLVRMNFPLEKYDITSSFNVYKAVYAVAHALHQALGCDSGECHRRSVYPWQVSKYELVFMERKKCLFNFNSYKKGTKSIRTV